jgi:hypothetical protein
MSRYSPEQRQAHAETLHELIRTWVEQGEADFEVELKRGVDWRTDVSSGDRRPKANSTLTLTLTINGGAEERAGPSIVPTTRVFGPPT